MIDDDCTVNPEAPHDRSWFTKGCGTSCAYMAHVMNGPSWKNLCAFAFSSTSSFASIASTCATSCDHAMRFASTFSSASCVRAAAALRSPSRAAEALKSS